uniref:Pirin N-terminal domain-containing protein n=2 Tax=Rhizochromulina marina TaxID=1034831 RepID=A0A7S2R3X4_9STRA|mmetsp:Transcript_10351/g.29558  ORF Transcript_10351/g.29558 Transcript_10351/m.29558 type:complete len:290 (+) Transcript_10351:125-994(+)|eukprot:CAMPEP_0118978112 /NCGR_PEP_ID=MMETSP1173-20130426/22893_1 /TAXON_ID=1034831 /ORGANISM="Rhizochromulina marina cf, Strain CCMP1243" /LENGTH=289 /DNA_ID=CAMNT_0006928285 /DNA_START=102 /DNA_END=971 /DNA_ORIENTATION=+
MSKPSAVFQHVPASALYVSEPNPSWFGNGENTPSAKGWTNGNWLKSRFHFSFAEYSNPLNSNFGVLRVMNDDLVQPRRGFGTHPHRDMEIMTYVVSGKLTHKDSMGNEKHVGRGGVQYMSAGTGVAHSEFNHHDEPLRFLQCWVVPDRRGHTPNYGQYDGEVEGRLNQWQHLASCFANKDVDTPVKVHQDVNLYATELQEGAEVSFTLLPGRQLYLSCMEGEVTMKSAAGAPLVLSRHDGLEVSSAAAGGEPLDITFEATAVEDSEGGPCTHLLMFDMKEDGHGGRMDL